MEEHSRINRLWIAIALLTFLQCIWMFKAFEQKKDIVADRITAREFVVMTADGRKVGHFGTTPERPGEVVLILKDDAEHIVALNVAHDFSGAIVKSGANEQKLYAFSPEWKPASYRVGK